MLNGGSPANSAMALPIQMFKISGKECSVFTELKRAKRYLGPLPQCHATVGLFCWLLNVPAIFEVCLLRQFYMLPC